MQVCCLNHYQINSPVEKEMRTMLFNTLISIRMDCVELEEIESGERSVTDSDSPVATE